MHDLINDIQGLSKSLDVALAAFRKRGEEAAATERDYKIALSTKILLERDKSTPVTIISDICRGSREIAELKFKRDVAEVVFDSAKEAIMIYKIKLKNCEAQLDREWNSGGKG